MSIKSKELVNNKVLYRIVFVFLTTNVSLFSYSQDSILLKKYFLKNYVFTGNHFQFHIDYLGVQKAKLIKSEGSFPVSTKSAHGYSTGLRYAINHRKNSSIITGIDFSIPGRNIICFFPKEMFTPNLERDYELDKKNSWIQDLVISVPIFLENRTLYETKKYWLWQAGVRINQAFGADFDDFTILAKNVNNTYTFIGSINTNANNERIPWPSFALNLGHGWLLKNNNLAQITLQSNLSFTKFVKGTFELHNSQGSIARGTYSSKGSYIAIGFTYVFTNANYRIRRIYETKDTK